MTFDAVESKRQWDAGQRVTMMVEDNGTWSLAEPGRSCRTMVKTGRVRAGVQPLMRACGKPAVVKLDRRRASTIRNRPATPLWYGYCEDLDHSYRRVIIEGAIYFVYELSFEHARQIVLAIGDVAR